MPRPRKQFGQHWLQSDKALSKILAAAELQKGDGDHPGDRVLEIGPGKGILTRPLVQQAATVVSVEIDRDLCELLAQKMGQLDNFLLLQGDFLTLDVDALLTPFPQFQQPNKVVANIPYNITGPILEKLLGTIAQPNPCPFESIVLLVQREVALRLRAQAGSTHFGALSVRVQYLATCELICDVPAKAFRPPPKVDSAVIRLRPRSLSTPATHPHHLEKLVKLGFSSKRKMLRNNLQSVVDRDRLETLLTGLGAEPTVRAEDLSVEQWVSLSNQLVPETEAIVPDPSRA